MVYAPIAEKGLPLEREKGVPMTETFQVRRVSKRDTVARARYAQLLTKYLYVGGADPRADIARAAEVFAARVKGAEDIGFVLLSHYASPDGMQVGRKFWWIEDTVVLPEWRKGGVADALEYRVREFLRPLVKPSHLILRVTVDKRRPHQLKRNGWVPLRETIDVAVKKPAVVHQLPLDVL